MKDKQCNAHFTMETENEPLTYQKKPQNYQVLTFLPFTFPCLKYIIINSYAFTQFV